MKTLSWTGLILALSIGAARGQDIDIKPPEFASWPEYCQARYVTVPPGSSSQWALTYPQTKIAAARQMLGPPTFERVHHYCNGIVWLARAQREPNPKNKQFMLTQARNEVTFTYAGLPKESPLVAPTFFALGQICMENGDADCAVDYLQQAVKARPTDPSVYSALAVFHRRQKDLNKARDILLEGDKAVGGTSAEINYNLGLIYIELGNVDAAVVRAHRAYEQGYPLPGLRTKLQRMGKWDNTPPPK